LRAEPFRLCLDLNIWVANFLAQARNLRGTAAQAIVEAVQDGRSGIGSIQLVVSHAMLSRLLTVLLRKGASLDSAAQLISLIENISRLGPRGEFPHLVLGGGFIPTRDAKAPVNDPYDPKFVAPPYDPEDGRVIDTAIAGRADALATANFRDFLERHDTVIVAGRVHIRHTAGHDLYIVQPREMAAWLRNGRRPETI
jgi:predicted nucleic acid-binding protein